MATPKKARIGTHVFSIVERTKDTDGMLNDDTCGYTLEQQNLIVIDASMPLSKKKLTLFHELLHATRMVFDSSYQPGKNDSFDVWEHYFIGIWEEALLLLFRDNPTLMKWLTDAETS
jgi:hypothetical protein